MKKTVYWKEKRYNGTVETTTKANSVELSQNALHSADFPKLRFCIFVTCLVCLERKSGVKLAPSLFSKCGFVCCLGRKERVGMVVE